MCGGRLRINSRICWSNGLTCFAGSGVGLDCCGGSTKEYARLAVYSWMVLVMVRTFNIGVTSQRLVVVGS
jgi:hypothetical protein